MAATKAGKKAPARAPRADAARNRDLLLEAAEAVFKERGAQASLDDVARRAGVGIGTLYRHFPTREALLAAACDERLFALAAASRRRDEAAAAPEGLSAYLKDLVRHATVYRGLATSLGVVLRNGSPGCHAATDEGMRLLERAKREGAVRRDVTLDDVVCMATAISLAAAEDEKPRARIDRLVTMFVDGMTAAR